MGVGATQIRLSAAIGPYDSLGFLGASGAYDAMQSQHDNLKQWKVESIFQILWQDIFCCIADKFNPMGNDLFKNW